jgi:hypothetical protein
MREWRNPLFFFGEDVVPAAGIPQIVWRESVNKIWYNDIIILLLYLIKKIK